MSYKKNAIKILEETGKPLSIREIVRQMPSDSLGSGDREKMKASVATALYREVNRGSLSRLILVDRGFFGLRKWAYPNDNPPSKIKNKIKRGASKLFKWEVNKQSIIAYYRQEDPYKHYCPILHFKTICLQAHNLLSGRNIEISSFEIIGILEGQDLSDNHKFNKKREIYKVNMVFNILIFEKILKKGRSGNGYILATNLDEFSEWITTLKTI